MCEEDIPQILELEKGNPLYFQFCPPSPILESILEDMHALPDRKDQEDKYYIGFFQGTHLAAIMDLIASYPKEDTVFIGFFMVAAQYSQQGKGSMSIQVVLQSLSRQGFGRVRLGYMKGNLQSQAFWNKCGFEKTGVQVETKQGAIIVLEQELL
ncbi:GNAT family N-acetyltransferase [Streptococcus gallolyticus]|nr:GNAT family N-acetyltransferase [Streptococcus gallolyticus]MBY5041943.1 GNAT family N-acetyltransferase [Streptococcus gallolyticus]